MRYPALLLVLFAFVPSCGTETLETPRHSAEVKSSLDTLWTRYADAADRRDREGLGLLFAEDAVLVPSGEPTVRGRKAIQEFLAGRYAAIDLTTFRVIPEDLKVSGSLAVQSGAFEEEFTEAESAKTSTGRFVLIAERGGDRAWRIRRLVAVADSTRG